ncbi:hypothetical protein ACQY0O_006908 [Thecaphora frezii]
MSQPAANSSTTSSGSYPTPSPSVSASSASPVKGFATSPADFALASIGPSHPLSAEHASPSASPILIPFRSPSKRQHYPFNASASPSKLSSNFSATAAEGGASANVGLGFSAVGPTPSHRGASAVSPTLGSVSGNGWGSSSIFLRRSAATAAATAAAAAAAASGTKSDNPSSPALIPGSGSPNFGAQVGAARFRRSSMLGREITPFELDEDAQAASQAGSSGGRLTSMLAVEKQVGFEPKSSSFKRGDSNGSRAASSPDKGAQPNDNTDEDDNDVDMDEDDAEPAQPPQGIPPTTPPTLSRSITRFSSSDSGQENSSSRNGSRSPGTAQPSTSLSSHSRSGSTVARVGMAGSLVTKRAVNRRANLAPKDRGVLRVAATLQDEKRPEDSEIASEAKLQKRLGGDPSMPRTPRIGFLIGGKVKSPFQNFRGFAGCAAGGSRGFASVGRGSARWGWDDDDYDSLDMDGIGNNDDDSYSSSEEEMTASTQAYVKPAESDDESAMRDEDRSGGARAASGSEATVEGPGSLPKNRKGSLWMGFRDSKPYQYRASPSADRLLRARTPGHSLPSELETSPKASMTAMSHSPNPWTRSSKRKTLGGEERYEPYANSAYKRRAVSPMTPLHTANHGVSSVSVTSPSLLAAQHFQLQQQQQGVGAMAMPTPISMPSPTHTFSTSASPAAPFGAYFSGSHYKPSQLGSGATMPGGSNRSRAASPSILSRPATPVSRAVTASGILYNYTSAMLNASAGSGSGVGVGVATTSATQPLASPSILSTSLGSVAGGNGSGGYATASRNSGSGPGYGSGALGLSIGGNSASVMVGGGGGGSTTLSTSLTGVAGGMFNLAAGGGSYGVGNGAGFGAGVTGGGGWLSGIGVEPGGYNQDELEGEEMDEGVRMLGLG